MSQPPTWDTTGQDAPPRPHITTNLTEPEWEPRPKRLLWSFTVVLIVAATVLGFTIAAAFALPTLSDTLIAAVPEELEAEYSSEELERAVVILMAAAHIITGLIALVVAATARSLVFRRSTAARVALVFTALLCIPVTALTLVLRDADSTQLWIHAAAGALLLCGLVPTLTPAVSRWLHQDEETRTIPLVPEGSGA